MDISKDGGYPESSTKSSSKRVVSPHYKNNGDKNIGKEIQRKTSSRLGEAKTSINVEDVSSQQKDPKLSLSQIRLRETFINVENLENEEKEQKGWKRKRKRNVRAPDTMEYMKSCRLHRLVHPLEENPILSAIGGFINLILIVIFSIPSTLLLIIFIPFCIIAKSIHLLCSKNMSFACSSCKAGLLSPHDAHFFLSKREPLVHSILVIDGSIDINRIRHTLDVRVIQAKTNTGDTMYPRLTQIVVHMPDGTYWFNDTSFNINNHIYAGPDIASEEDLQKYISGLLFKPLNDTRPLWEVIVLNSFARGRDTVLVCRLHQCLADGMSLLRLLCQSLSDNQIMQIPQKPHFGGITYGMNLFRSLMVGPLTLLTWILWCDLPKNLLVYRRSSYLATTNGSTSSSNHPLVNGSKKCCGCNSVKETSGQNSVTSGSSEGGNSLKVASKPGTNAYTVLNINESPGYFILWSSKIQMNKIVRIKQVTRTCLNDVLLTCLTGALRITLQRMGVLNPQNFKVNVTVDLRSNTLPYRVPKLGNKSAMVPITLPIEIEGAIPRIWKLRETMDDMKASADAVVSYCFIWWAYKCLPKAWTAKLIERLHARGSLQYSSLPGPSAALLFRG